MEATIDTGRIRFLSLGSLVFLLTARMHARLMVGGEQRVCTSASVFQCFSTNNCDQS
jgi:hypothetical protein